MDYTIHMHIYPLDAMMVGGRNCVRVVRDDGLVCETRYRTVQEMVNEYRAICYRPFLAFAQAHYKIVRCPACFTTYFENPLGTEEHWCQVCERSNSDVIRHAFYKSSAVRPRKAHLRLVS